MSIVYEENVMVPMRDGVKLATDVYRPAREGRWPVLVTRVPYNKSISFPSGEVPSRRIFLELDLDAWRLVQAGYVIVAQDTRGRYASEGEFDPYVCEFEDGADTIAWAASQPWSSGQVGMFGVSYQGVTQWQAAREQPSALKAIVPAESPAWHVYPYQGGAFLLGMTLGWTLGPALSVWSEGAPAEDEEMATEGQESDSAAGYAALPLLDVPMLRERAPYYIDWLEHPTPDAYWAARTSDAFYEHIAVPTLSIAGWYDFFLADSLKSYQSAKQRGSSELARSQQRLVIGPWSHGNFMQGFQGRNYGMASFAREMLTDLHLRWYDHWLKGLNTGIEKERPVLIFVMGANIWRDEESWPLPDTQYCSYYLHSAGDANTATGGGTLSPSVAVEEPEDVYRYNPLDPVPTTGGSVFTDDMIDGTGVGPLDQREVELREDVLCYTTAPFEQSIEVTGPIELVLYVSSATPDTDFTGKLVDLHPDGRAEILTDGILRARYRESLSEPGLMEPGRIYELHIDLGATSNVFLAGHSIRLEVSSSNFPRFDRNSNTGGVIATERAEEYIATVNRVYHSQLYPSHLILPIIERGN